MNAEMLALLRATIEKATSKVPFYRCAYEGVDCDVSKIEHLQRFPIINRSIVSRKGTEFLSEDAVATNIAITGGTHFSPGSDDSTLIRFRTNAEVSLLRGLYEQTAASISGMLPLTLSISGMSNGADVGAGLPGIFVVPLESEYHIEVIKQLLHRRFAFPGFEERLSMLRADIDSLKLVTWLASERPEIIADLHVKAIISQGGLLTEAWRQEMMRVWKAPIEDVYGLAETPGVSARKCRFCGCFHLTGLAVYEFLHLTSDQPVTHGCARLVVTCLYPLNQAQPLIRYDTGDIFEIIGQCPATGQTKLQLAGRYSDSFLEGAFLVLTDYDILRVLDDFPEVARSQITRGVAFSAPGLGPAKYSVTATKSLTMTQLTLRVWCAERNMTNISRQKLGNHVKAGLQKLRPTLRELIQQERYVLEVECLDA